MLPPPLLLVEVLPSVEPVQVQKPPKFFYLLGDEGGPYNVEMLVLKLRRESGVCPSRGEAGAVQEVTLIRVVREHKILQQDTKRKQLASSGRG